MSMNIERLFEELPIEQQRTLRAQIDRFIKLKEIPRKPIEINDIVKLPAGTLIHGTSVNHDTLSSIAASGIITGQAFGIEEDGETYHCADFHRVDKEISLANYNNQFSYNDGRCPFGKRGKFTLAFIIYPDKALEQLVSYDCYRDGTTASKETQEFVNMKGLPLSDKPELGASILFGIPSNFINGIALGDRNIQEEEVKFLIETFPGVYITRNNGELIYKYGDNLELVSARIKSIQRQIKLEEAEYKIEQSEKRIDIQKHDSEKMWAAIATLPVEQIAQIYESIGWQGDFTESARRLKEQYGNQTGMKM